MWLPTLLTRRDALLSTTALLSASSLPPTQRAPALLTPSPIAIDAADGRDYGYLQLANGLRCLLVCGPSERSELALTVRCGSLDDPLEFEGLAHLTEHLTLGTDAAGLGGLIDELEGDLNGFTAEETTTFECAWEPVDDEPERALQEVSRRFAALFAPPPAGAFEKVVERELRRIDEEMAAAAELPGRQLLELAQYKARASPNAEWARLARGDLKLLPLSRAAEMVDGVDTLRQRRYGASTATLALVSPLPLATTVAAVRAAFDGLPAGPSGGGGAAAAAAAAAAVDALAAAKPTPFAGGGGGGGDASAEAAADAAALLSPSRRRAALSVAWCVRMHSPVEAARHKPLALIAAAVGSPHAGGLVSTLRTRGLSPLGVELEPIVSARTVASAAGWALWQLEVTLRPEASQRWREALALVEQSVGAIARDGLPMHVAAEAQAAAGAAWRGGKGRLPNAIELAASLQAEPSGALALRAARAFVGPPAELAADATATATSLSATRPIATLWLPSPSSSPSPASGGAADASASAAAAALPPLLRVGRGRQISLQPVPLPRPPDDAEPPPPLPALISPPPNPFFALDGSDDGGGATEAAPGARPRLMEARVERRDGVRALQLPGCVDGAYRSYIDGVGCGAAPGEVLGGVDGSPRQLRGDPTAAAVVQMMSDAPAAASREQRAAAELWRWSLAQALATDGALAARAGLRWELSYNARGARLAVSGRAASVRLLLLRALGAMLRGHDPRTSPADEWAAARRAALSAVDAAVPPAERSAAAAALRATTADDVAAERARFLGSVSAVELLLAGPIGAAEAATLCGEARRAFAPLLPPELREAASLSSDRAALRDALREWEPRLYRPRWQPQPLAQNPCFDAALGATLDQCGAVANA